MRLRPGSGPYVEVDLLFVALFAAVFLSGYPLHGLLVLGSLAAHELAHVLVAALLGVEVQAVRLSPVGGILRLGADLEHDPHMEVPIAVAGPIQSFFLAGVAHVLLGSELWDRPLVAFFLDVNLSLGFFNLLPALPLDGGRVLRGILGHRHGHAQVTRWMALSGRVTGVGLTAFGVLALAAGRPLWTGLVAGPLLFLEAGREEQAVLYRSMRGLLRRRGEIARRRVAPARVLVAVASARLREVLPQLAQRHYHVVLVLGDSLEPIGMLTESQLVAAFTTLGPEATLAAALNPNPH